MCNSLNPIINALENLFTDLNNQFYGGSLEKPVISVSPDTTKGAYGWCTTWRAWTEADAAEENESEGYYEINMCAEHIGRSIYDTVGTLLHEMAHLKNLQDGVKDCSRGGTYHNAAFKRTAEAHGLTVEKTEKYGFSFTKLNDDGMKFVWDYEKANGNPFGLRRKDLGAGKKEKTRTNSIKMVCPCCGNIVRATKPVRIVCYDCEVEYEVEI